MPFSGVQTCARSEEHTSELQSHSHLVCRLLLEKKNPRRPCHRHRHRPRPSVRTPHRRRPEPPSPSPAAFPAPCPHTATPSAAQFFFFNDTAPTEIYTLSLHDALPI